MPIATRFLMALGVFFLPSCEDSSQQKVSISIQVDEASCGTSMNLAIDCQSLISVQVSAENGQLLASDCIALPSNSQALSGLAQLLSSSASLGSLPTETPLRISLAVYSTLEGTSCIGDLPDNPYIQGSTEMVALGSLDGSLRLILSCSSPVGPGEEPDPSENGIEGCNNCGMSLQQCLDVIGLSSCDDVRNRCEEECSSNGSMNCEILCSLLSSNCQDSDGGPVLSCTQIPDGCIESCNGDNGANCKELCSSFEANCENTQEVIESCQLQAQPCPEDCRQGGSCLSTISN